MCLSSFLNGKLQMIFKIEIRMYIYHLYTGCTDRLLLTRTLVPVVNFIDSADV